MKSKQLFLVAIALLCGLVSAIGIIQAMGDKNAPEPTMPMGAVLVANAHLDIKTELTEENVKLENWPVKLIPEGSAASLEEVKGKLVNARFRKGQPIVLADAFNREDFPGVKIPPGHKVINLKVPPEDVMTGLMNPGDRVDIIGVFDKRDRSGDRRSETRTFLKGIRIFNIGSSTTAQEKQAKAGGSSGIVGVLVTQKQAETIVWAKKNGEIRLALIGDAEEESDPDEDFNFFEDDSLELDSVATSVKEEPVPMAKHQTRVYQGGDDVTTVFFDENNNVVNMTQEGPSTIGRPNSRGSIANPVDYEESDGPAEVSAEIEEDQYRGE